MNRDPKCGNHFTHLDLCTVPNNWTHTDYWKQRKWMKIFVSSERDIFIAALHLRQTFVQYIQVILGVSLVVCWWIFEFFHWIAKIPVKRLNNTLRDRFLFGSRWHRGKANVFNFHIVFTELIDALLQFKHGLEECFIECWTEFLNLENLKWKMSDFVCFQCYGNKWIQKQSCTKGPVTDSCLICKILIWMSVFFQKN